MSKKFCLNKEYTISLSSHFESTFLLLVTSKDIKVCLLSVIRSIRRRCSLKNSVLKTFANIAGKHLCWSLFSICRSLVNIC